MSCQYPELSPLTGYRKNCRCSRCVTAQRIYERERSKKRRLDPEYVMVERVKGRIRTRKRRASDPAYRERQAAWMREYRRRKRGLQAP